MNTSKQDAVHVEGLRVLVVDDEKDIRNGLQKLISGLGATVQAAADGVEALGHFEDQAPDLVLTDLMMPRMTGGELLLAIKERFPETEVIMLTGFGTIQGAVSCIQDGAAHFMTKPFDNTEVVSLVTRLGRQILARRAPQANTQAAPRIIAEDASMVRVLQLVERVAGSPMSVLIEGESGTGKEVIASAIHARSAARDRKFCAVNAAALSDSLLESELFGHRRGAFTGADRDHVGLFEEARGGTVFLDELCSMSPSFQGKLLRVLEERHVRRVGGDRDIPVQFRLISATNRDLEALIRKGDFREDLFYRVGVMRIHLPPLRERRADIVPLALRFLQEAAATCLGPEAPIPELTAGTIDSLHAHRWPGNVRELQNAIQRALIVSSGDRIQAHNLGLKSSTWSAKQAEPGDDYAQCKKQAVAEFQREFVQRALENSAGNISLAASQCGMTRAALQRILRQHDIDSNRFK